MRGGGQLDAARRVGGAERDRGQQLGGSAMAERGLGSWHRVHIRSPSVQAANRIVLTADHLRQARELDSGAVGFALVHNHHLDARKGRVVPGGHAATWKRGWTAVNVSTMRRARRRTVIGEIPDWTATSADAALLISPALPRPARVVPQR